MRISLPVAALVTLVLLLGHDALMATDPHGQVSPHEQHQVVEHEAASCLAIDGARVDRPDVPALADTAMDVPGTLVWTSARTTGAVRWWAAPGYPPDVRRAMLQVFLN